MTNTPCCSGIYGKGQYSNITNAQIDNICAGLHLPAPPFSPTTAEQGAYDQCVADKRAERAGTRINTFTSIADWFAQSFLGRGGRGRDDDDGPPPSPDGMGTGTIIIWISVILLIIVLTIVAVKYFGKKG